MYIDLGRDHDLGFDRTVEAMRQRAHQVPDAAYEAGVRYVEAARSYGLAEEFVVSWFATRNDPVGDVVGSKWGYRYVGNWHVEAAVREIKDHTVEALGRHRAESRAILGERLGLYQIHSATPGTGVLRDRDVLRELAALPDSGLAIGLTVTGFRARSRRIRSGPMSNRRTSTGRRTTSARSTR